MKLFKIKVTGTPKDFEDIEEDPRGTYEIKAESEDQALDEFHSTIPIACLDDFTITIKEI